ncbi:hypothetical protein CGH64_23095, partial [Vibrio parahaemolyticus]
MKKLISAPVFFLAGSFLYMIVPWVMYEINYLQVEFLIRAVENHIHLAKHYETIIVDFFVMNLSFTMGYWIAVRCGVTKLHITGMQRFPISKSLIFILLVFISVLGGYKIVSAGV